MPKLGITPHYPAGAVAFEFDNDDDDSDSDSNRDIANRDNDDEVSLGSVESAIIDSPSRASVERQSSWGTLCTSGGSGHFASLGPPSSLALNGSFNSSASSLATLGTSGGPNNTFAANVVSSSLAMHNSGTFNNSASSWGTLGASGGPNSAAFSNVASIVKLHHSGNLHNSGGSWGTLGASGEPNTFANVPSTLGMDNSGESWGTLGPSGGPTSFANVSSSLGLHNAGHPSSSLRTIGASVVAPPPGRLSLSNRDRRRQQDAGVLATSVHSSASSKGSSMSSWAVLGASSGSEHFPSVTTVSAPPRASVRSSASSWGTLGHSAGSGSFPNVSASALQV